MADPWIPVLVSVLQLTLLLSTSHGTEVSTVDMSQDLAHDGAHPCSRNCSEHSDARVCSYIFKVEWYTSLSKACYECPHPASDCLLHNCIPADGHKKPLVTVNRRLPGPTIQVCQGDEIIVDVQNDLMSDSTSIHWHGLHMVGTPYMDGVPFLTQCPITPGTTFRYHFLADLSGTHYWHSHSGFQRDDGMFGSLTVRSAMDPLAKHYDVDDPSHLLLLSDWLEDLAVQKFVYHHHSMHDNKPYNILVNGRGYIDESFSENAIHPPLSAITVKKGLRYRLRSISNSIQNCPIEVSVDDHNLLLITKDGAPVEPVIVESFVIYGGERWDFVLEANRPVGNYWIKFHGLLDCDDRFRSAHQVAVLRYEGAADELPAPIKTVTWNSTKREGYQVNTLNKAPGDTTFKTIAEMRSVTDADDYSGTPDHSFWLDFDFHPIDNELFHKKDFYGFYQVPSKHRLYMPQLNYITLKMPSAPPLSQYVPEDSFCNSNSDDYKERSSNSKKFLIRTANGTKDCVQDFCHCTHTLNVGLNSLVEVVLIDKGLTYYANHPFHLHGHAFAVLGMSRLGENTTLEAVQLLDEQGNLTRNFERPPIMDTVTVPDGGYTVIRFRATNPGYWLFHCHISFHVETGMGLIFKVGDKSMVPPVPDNFPRCGSWQPPRTKNLKSTIEEWLNNLENSRTPPFFTLLPSVNESTELDNIVGPTYATSADLTTIGSVGPLTKVSWVILFIALIITTIT